MRFWNDDMLAAPKGVRVLLLLSTPDRRVVVGSWSDDRHAKRPRPHWKNDLSHLMGVGWTREFQPTHWMLLPEAPA